MYSFELFSSFSEGQIRGIFRDLFRSAPQEHSMAMWAKIADGIDLQGIYRDATNDAQEQARRITYRGGLKYRFVEAALSCWMYIVNVDPLEVDQYKEVAF